MTAVVGILAIGLFVLVVTLMATRAGEVFRIEIRDGQISSVRGQIPAALRHDLADVAQRAAIKRATLRGLRQQGKVRLAVRGVDEGIAQRLRNTVGIHRL